MPKRTASQQDTWDLRLPDGRMVRSLSTQTLRQHIDQGRVPRNSQVRRTELEEWTLLEWVAELVPAPGDTRNARKTPNKGGNNIQTQAPGQPLPVAPLPAARVPTVVDRGEAVTVGSRLNSRRLGTLDVPTAFQEVLAALDLTLVQRKVTLAVIYGLCLGSLLLFALHANLENAWPRLLIHGSTAAVFLLFASFSTAILCRMTYQEVSMLRPARWRGSMRGVLPLALRLLLASLILVGGVVGLVLLLLSLPGWIFHGPANLPVVREGTVTLLHALAVVLAALILPLFCLAQFLAPILVVEECSTWQALRVWRQVVRANLGRILLHEILAIGLGLLLIVPPALILAFLSWPPLQEACGFALTVAWHLLGGVLVGLLLTFLVVVHVFLYLNLRYENAGGR
jgi:hypothetical protein